MDIAGLPVFGTVLLYAVMIAAAYTFAVSVQAGASRSLIKLQAARFGAYGTVGLIASAVIVLAYGFVTHDFRLRYVAGHSDRTMPLGFLFSALWGGQDGSLLWWMFLLSVYIGLCVKFVGKKYIDLQPYVIATLMAVVFFFCVIMNFAANPFGVQLGAVPADGKGLNPLLQDFYMIIHPPSLYTGFVGATVPFAFCIAGLVTGRLDTEWIRASRKWMLFCWMFLSIGNVLGMLWAYKELGWGGYWAWDPVENAAFMPWLVATAYLHSVMIQERRGMFKVWNVFLVSLTFFMTIFGTFLTRAGLIASVHAFAQSSIGIYFVYFLACIVVVTFTLVLYRWPELRDYPARPELRKHALIAGWLVAVAVGPGFWLFFTLLRLPTVASVSLFCITVGATVFFALEKVYFPIYAKYTRRHVEIESWKSREFTYVMNNWALLSFLVFVLVATMFPAISEKVFDEKVTVGPPYYNAWVQPLGLGIYTLMGIGTIFGWKKTSDSSLKAALKAPLIATVVATVLHAAFGKALGFPPVVWSPPVYEGGLGSTLRAFNAFTPIISVAVATFNMAVIVREFNALLRSKEKEDETKTPLILWLLGFFPGLLFTVISLPAAGRRRYGGYVVHAGLVVMLLGFTGQSWTKNSEMQLAPGQSFEIEGYSLRYEKPRMEVDTEKRMVLADVTVFKGGKEVGKLNPGKFIYKKQPGSPTTEVSMVHSLRDDLYLVLGQANPQTKVASFQVHINPLVSWVWGGCLILLLGAVACLWPEPQPDESRAWRFSRGLAATASGVMFGILLATMPAPGFAQSSSAHSGTVHIENETERELFGKVRCMCGGCERLLLTACACAEAADTRDHMRGQLRDGMSVAQIVDDYIKQHGTDAAATPPNRGGMRAIYIFPLAAAAAASLGVWMMTKRWKNKPAPVGKDTKAISQTAEDARLDRELEDME